MGRDVLQHRVTFEDFTFAVECSGDATGCPGMWVNQALVIDSSLPETDYQVPEAHCIPFRILEVESSKTLEIELNLDNGERRHITCTNQISNRNTSTDRRMDN